jgi:hypothetical protein
LPLSLCHRTTDLTSLEATDMEHVQGFRSHESRDAEERFAARIVGVGIALIFGLIVILHAISS